MDSAKYIGAAAFGLRDVISCGDAGASPVFSQRSEDFHPSCVILSDDINTLPLTGIHAKQDRSGLGFPFPPEAAAASGHPELKRALISLVWKKLMEDIDSVHKWGQVNCSRVLAEHIRAQLPAELDKNSHVAVAVPNFINMNAREYLLQDLKQKLGLKNIRLVWRNVAAAIDWLRRPTHQDFFAQEFAPGSTKRLGVLYLGLDGIDFDSFPVHPELNGKYFVPVRDFPDAEHERFPFDGFDLFDAFLNKCAPEFENDYQAKWQILNLCDQVWPALLDLPKEDKSYILYLQQQWLKVENLAFDQYISDDEVNISDCKIESGVINRALHIPIDVDDSAYRNKYWLPALTYFVRANTDVDDLAALIVTGPLSSEFIARKLANSLYKTYMGDNHAGRGVWYTEDDDIANGAALFAQRVDQDLPSYNDKLEQLSIFALVEGQERPQPISLLNSQILKDGFPAGKLYSRTIKDITFYLPENISLFEVCLAKGKFDPQSTSNQLRSGVVPFKVVSRKRLKLTTKVEMSAASGFAVINFSADDPSPNVDRRLRKGQDFDFNSMTAIRLDEIYGKFRRGLSYPPDREFESFVFYDDDRRFIRCRVAVNSLQEFLDRKADNIERALDNVIYKLNEGYPCSYKLKKIFDELPQTSVFNAQDSLPFNDGSRRKKQYALFDQYGNIKAEPYKDLYTAFKAKYIEILTKLHTALQQDNDVSYCNQQEYVNMRNKLIKQASYLRSCIPEIFKRVIWQELENNPFRTRGWQWGARIFCSAKDIKKVFSLFEQQFSSNQGEFKGTHAYALSQLLDNIPCSKEVIERRQALLMIDCALELMQAEFDKDNIKINFFNGAYLILCALKYRRQEKHFMSLAGGDISKADRRRYDAILQVLEQAVSFHAHSSDDDNRRGRKGYYDFVSIRDSIKGYLEDNGSEAGLEAVRSAAGDTEA